MPQFPIVRMLANVAVTRVDGEFQIRIEDGSGDTFVYHADSEQVLKLADSLDDLLADEEAEEPQS